MKKGLGSRVQDNPCNTVLKVLSMIGAAFLAGAGGYMHTAQAGDHTSRSSERTHALAEERTYARAEERTYARAKERTHSGQAEERNRVSDTKAGNDVSTAASRHFPEPTEERQYSGATARHDDR